MRHVSRRPLADFFKPVGVPCHALEIVTLALDEVEALRLADLEGLYQEQASAQMKISRQTFARIVEAARRKTADALIHGKALRLEGGTVTLKGTAEKSGSDGTTSARKRGACGCGRRRGCKRPNTRPEKVGKDDEVV
jgi:predicted DNA-binding protein (UPF0251 family)